ncbi:Zn-ribbon domain-containing OB-fold protein [Pusillimonas sp. ANT_WB101]|uniref:Zn-ribbon domain-containing OB-fold protein n=1 Tax=Pusillimonas sp. ANT_WB101 TaxID=2597356 RepID=UPI0011EF84ED|nr:Zn-ribbon domain-containing OB-fold protein [Pusillimonas sp. ANT_WB101]KAA0889418.1 Zn-ribbon domain-containing OB-fold protein [Pusillimonas sp. ANT_WB101]
MPSTDSPNYSNDPFAQAYPETLPFWEAAEAGKLLLKTCTDCGKAHWYPRIICPLCRSSNTTWGDASGRGTVYSYSIAERADPPYVLAWVKLDEGPILITNLVDCDHGAIKIGMEVHARFETSDTGRKVPVFAPRP